MKIEVEHYTDNKKERISCSLGSCHHTGLKGSACVSLVPIFNHLEEEQMEEISGLTQSVSIKKGEFLYRPEEESSSLYILNQGKIKIYRSSESGKEQLQRILYPGDFTGELALFNEKLHDSYAVGLEDTEICKIKREDLQGLLLKYPVISLKILKEFSERLLQSERQASRYATEKVESRLAMYLIETMEELGGDRSFKLPMTKKDLASYLGTTPESISRKFVDLEEMHLITPGQNGIITIIDLEGLNRV